MNNSEQRMINLVKARIKNAMRTAANNMSVDIYSDGALANQIGGLAALITQAGTGTVGGINSSTYTFWKNQFVDMTSPASTNIIGYMNQAWLSLVPIPRLRRLASSLSSTRRLRSSLTATRTSPRPLRTCTS